MKTYYYLDMKKCLDDNEGRYDAIVPVPEEGKAATCKKKDVLGLAFESYQANKESVLEGYRMARKFLFSQYVFRMRGLKYTTEFILLAVI